MKELKDFYDILGVSREATEQDIKHAYRKLAVQSHPDTHPHDKAAEERFKKISEAYATLGNPEERRKYDAELFLQRKHFGGPDTAPSTPPPESQRPRKNPEQSRAETGKFDPIAEFDAAIKAAANFVHSGRLHAARSQIEFADEVAARLSSDKAPQTERGLASVVDAALRAAANFAHSGRLHAARSQIEFADEIAARLSSDKAPQIERGLASVVDAALRAAANFEYRNRPHAAHSQREFADEIKNKITTPKESPPATQAKENLHTNSTAQAAPSKNDSKLRKPFFAFRNAVRRKAQRRAASSLDGKINTKSPTL